MTTTDLMLPAKYSPVDLAVAGYLAAYKGATRTGYAMDIRIYLRWCVLVGLDPWAAKRAHIELFIRWLEEERHLKPATVSRRLSTVIGFYRSSVIDGYLDGSPAQYVRRPKVPFESPTLGLTHLQFEAVIRESRKRPDDEALIMLLGMLGLRVSEACALDVTSLGWEHGHRTVKVLGKGGTITLMPLPPMVMRAMEAVIGDRTEGPLLRNKWGQRMQRANAAAIVARLAAKAGVKGKISPHSLRHTMVTTMLDAGVSLRDVQIAARHADPRTTTRYDRARNNLDRHGVYALAAFMGSAG